MSYKLNTYSLSMYRPNMYKLGYRVQTRYHEPHSPSWVTAYWVFILEYSWNILNKFFYKFSSHYYIMVYIKNLLEICHVKKIQAHLQVHLLLKNIGYTVLKMLLGIFHSLDWFQTFRIYIPIHLKMTLCESNFIWSSLFFF